MQERFDMMGEFCSFCEMHDQTGIYNRRGLLDAFMQEQVVCGFCGHTRARWNFTGNRPPTGKESTPFVPVTKDELQIQLFRKADIEMEDSKVEDQEVYDNMDGIEAWLGANGWKGGNFCGMGGSGFPERFPELQKAPFKLAIATKEGVNYERK